MTFTDCKGRECRGSFTSEEEFLDFAIPSPPEGTDKCAAYAALTCDPKGGEHIFEGPGGFRVDANTAGGARKLRLFLHGSLPTIGTHCPGCFSFTSCRPGCKGMFPALDLDRIPLLPPKGQMMAPSAPRCPATHRHARRYGAEVTGIQCRYEPPHDGDHCAFVFGEGDIFWPQETAAATEAGAES